MSHDNETSQNYSLHMAAQMTAVITATKGEDRADHPFSFLHHTLFSIFSIVSEQDEVELRPVYS
jgi:hypothetical protein